MELMEKIKALLGKGQSVEEVASECGVSPAWVRAISQADSWGLVKTAE